MRVLLFLALGSIATGAAYGASSAETTASSPKTGTYFDRLIREHGNKAAPEGCASLPQDKGSKAWTRGLKQGLSGTKFIHGKAQFFDQIPNQVACSDYLPEGKVAGFKKNELSRESQELLSCCREGFKEAMVQLRASLYEDDPESLKCEAERQAGVDDALTSGCSADSCGTFLLTLPRLSGCWTLGFNEVQSTCNRAIRKRFTRASLEPRHRSGKGDREQLARSERSGVKDAR